MTDVINSILSPNTVVSLITSFCAFYTAFKIQEEKVKRQEEEIKEIKARIAKIEEKVEGIDNSETKIKIAEIQKDIIYLRERFDEYLSTKKQ